MINKILSKLGLFSPQGKMRASASHDQTVQVKLWDAGTGAMLHDARRPFDFGPSCSLLSRWQNASIEKLRVPRRTMGSTALRKMVSEVWTRL